MDRKLLESMQFNNVLDIVQQLRPPQFTIVPMDQLYTAMQESKHEEQELDEQAEMTDDQRRVHKLKRCLKAPREKEGEQIN